MEIYDLGGYRYSFVFYHVLDMKKVVEGGSWTFKQSLLVYRPLMENEDPHVQKLNEVDIWVQVYDVPKGCISESILKSIGNYVGVFIKSDPKNIDGVWKPFVCIRVTIDIDKPMRRRMKIKRDGGAWNWVNFKYERLSTFCFVCGMLGHSERECAIVYANPEKEFERASGAWLRAPNRNAANKNIGARWLRNGSDGGNVWLTNGDGASSTADVHGGEMTRASFMEIDGMMREISGGDGGIQVLERNQEEGDMDNNDLNQGRKIRDTIMQ